MASGCESNSSRAAANHFVLVAEARGRLAGIIEHARR